MVQMKKVNFQVLTERLKTSGLNIGLFYCKFIMANRLVLFLRIGRCRFSLNWFYFGAGRLDSAP